MEDRFYQIYDNEILIPGIEGETRLMHISDTHICAYDGDSSEEEVRWAFEKDAYWMYQKKEFAQMAGEYFGKEQEISTVSAFRKLMKLAEKTKPDFLVFSGDNLEIMHPAGERFLKAQLDSYSGRYLCIPGNHEDEELEGIWQADPVIIPFRGFSIVGIDDRLKTVSDRTLEVLKELAEKAEPVIIVTHIPVSTDLNREAMSIFDSYFYIDEDSSDSNAREFVKLIKENDCFRAVLCGHVHGYSKTEIAPGKYQICSSQGMIGAVDMVTVRGR